MLPQWQKMLLIMKVWSSVSESLENGMIFFFLYIKSLESIYIRGIFP